MESVESEIVSYGIQEMVQESSSVVVKEDFVCGSVVFAVDISGATLEPHPPMKLSVCGSHS